jgi:hypothetical protein
VLQNILDVKQASSKNNRVSERFADRTQGSFAYPWYPERTQNKRNIPEQSEICGVFALCASVYLHLFMGKYFD